MLGAAMKRYACVVAIAMLMAPGFSDAAVQENTRNEAPAENTTSEATPLLPPQSQWPGMMVIIVLGMFLAAAVVGPIVRLNMPEEVPPAHSHDEPPGASGHHGPGGLHDSDAAAVDHGGPLHHPPDHH